jgi:uncharacterized damage-inducible protein DinB
VALPLEDALGGDGAQRSDAEARVEQGAEQRYPDFLSLEGDSRSLEASTRVWLESESDWPRPIETIARRGDGRLIRVGFTPETLAFQLFYYEVHHRAQVMAMLRHLGIAAEGLDFNRYAFQWTEPAPI